MGRILDKIRTGGEWLDKKLFPFAQFKDVSAPELTRRQREEALKSNKENRNLILPYVNGWGQFLALNVIAARGSQLYVKDIWLRFVVEVTTGITASIVLCMLMVMVVGWFLLWVVE